MAAMEREKGPLKKRLKKASSSNIETTLVVATPASGMVFPHNEAVENATHKKKRKRSYSGVNKKKGPAVTTSIANTVSSRSVTGSNDPFPLQIEQPPIVHQDTVNYETTLQTVQAPRKKHAIKKKLTPKKVSVEVANPASPASNTRSKKKLHLD
ncbi:unnamed protein product [Urochloa humidicola]